MRPFLALLIVAGLPGSAATAQDRPLVTEKAETVPEGTLRTELGFDFLQNAVFRFSGLKGDLTRIGILGLRMGAGPRIEIQLFWTAQQFLNVDSTFEGPNSPNLDFSGNSTSDFGDLILGTKFRLLDEGRTRPALGFRFNVELPNGASEKGLSNDETNFYSALLVQKSVGKATLLGNLGLAILGDPGSAGAQDDLLLYGLAVLYPVTSDLNLLGDWSGRAGPGGIGTEEQSMLRLGAQIKAAGLTWDAALLLGFLDTDPSSGLIVGLSKDFDLPFLR